MSTNVITATHHPSTITPTAASTGSVAHFVAGARAMTPMVIGVVPFGLAIGAAAAASDTTTAAALANAPLILAGAAQLTAIQMLDAGVAPLVIIVSALMINARILLYSTSLAPWFRGASLGRRLLLAFPVIDQMHFTCVPRFEQGDLDRRGRTAFYAGAATWLVSSWIAANSVAILVGARLPDAAGLHLAAPVALAGLLAKSIDGAQTRSAAATAAVVAVVAVGLPFRSVVLVASLAGIAVGTAHASAGRDRRSRQSEVGS